ncbi:MAG: hypothetical protein ACO1OC_07830 [Tuberibacillus sp.]
MKKESRYKSADLPDDTIRYIKEVERDLSNRVGKPIALVAYTKDDGRK